MTEDESFIRTIVDNANDDMPRLIYADWLDEQGDPRGSYLRAECDAVTLGRAVELRKLSEELDPVWVARVSRPPFGVCCQHLQQNSSNEYSTREQLDEAAQELDEELPPELQALLLNYDLGEGMKYGPFDFPSSAAEYSVLINCFVCMVDRVNPLLDSKGCNHGSDELVDRSIDNQNEGLESHYMYLAKESAGPEYVVSCDEFERGAVYEVRDFDDIRPMQVAESIGEFLAMLKPRVYPLAER